MNLPYSFLEATKLENQKATDMMRGMPEPAGEMAIPGNPSFVELLPPEEVKITDVSFWQVLNRRQSSRDFSEEHISIEELSGLLWASQGVKRSIGNITLRTVPSAGARHPFETFVHVNRVRGIEKGLTRFCATRNKLLRMGDKDLSSEITSVCLGQDFVSNCAAIFVWTAVPDRMTWKYGDRGYRYILMEAGHLCQNLYLTATAMDLACCAVGAFDDDGLNKILGASGKDMFAVYLAAVGKAK